MGKALGNRQEPFCAGKSFAIEGVNVLPGSQILDSSAGYETTGSPRRLPSFFVIGPPRTGTSWLHEVLSQCTLLPSPTKETRFFDVHFHRGTDWYLRHYRGQAKSSRLIGEVAPTYFASDQARERMLQTVPCARVICIFRNPVHRVLSLYRIKRAYGMVPWNFEQALERDPELMASSQYATNLKAWQASFGADRVLPTLYDDLRQRPQFFLDTLLDFIGAPRITLSPSQLRRVHSSEKLTHPRHYYVTRTATKLSDWLKAQNFDDWVATLKRSRFGKLFLGGGPAFEEPSTGFISQLYERFRPEVEELETLLQCDLSAWKSNVPKSLAA
jgi:hypothetical protein